MIGICCPFVYLYSVRSFRSFPSQGYRKTQMCPCLCSNRAKQSNHPSRSKPKVFAHKIEYNREYHPTQAPLPSLNQVEPPHARRLQPKPNQTKPNQTKPNQTKPNQTKPNQTKRPTAVAYSSLSRYEAREPPRSLITPRAVPNPPERARGSGIKAKSAPAQATLAAPTRTSPSFTNFSTIPLEGGRREGRLRARSPSLCMT